MKTTPPPTNWYMQLQQNIINAFDLEGLDLLCFGLDISFENLQGKNRTNKAISLIEHMKRQQRLAELVNACQRLRPTVAWNNIRPLRPKTSSSVPLSERFSLELHPEILEDGGVCEVVINNEGIQFTKYTIIGDDPAGIVTLEDGQERQKSVSAGDTGKINLRVVPRKRPLIGRPRNHTFTVQVRTSPHHHQSVTGQIVVNPLLPSWVATLLPFLSMIVTIGISNL